MAAVVAAAAEVMAAVTEAAMAVEKAAEAEASVADGWVLPNTIEPAHAGSFHCDRLIDGIFWTLIDRAKRRYRVQSRTNKVTKGSGPTCRLQCP